jgi:hypothetical protein
MRRMIALLLAAGCGESPGGMTPARDMATMPVEEQCKTDDKPVMLAAHYAVRGSLTANVKVPASCTGDCIFDADAKAQILLLADVTQNGQSSTVTARPCSIQIPRVALKGQPMPTELTAPDALVQSVKPVTAMAAMDGPNTCAAFTSMPLAIVIGARLATPAADPLPSFDGKAMPSVKLCAGKSDTACGGTMENGCICDQDQDRSVGATVNASGVPVLDDVDKIYLALRTVVSLEGQIFPASAGQSTPGPRIKGTIAGLKLDQSPVGCHRKPPSPAMPYDCDASMVGQVATFNPRVSQSTNTKSTFVAMPVPDGYTCDKLVADASNLFKGQ